MCEPLFYYYTSSFPMQDDGANLASPHTPAREINLEVNGGGG